MTGTLLQNYDILKYIFCLLIDFCQAIQQCHALNNSALTVAVYEEVLNQREESRKTVSHHEGLIHEMYVLGMHKEAEAAIDRALEVFPDSQYFQFFKGNFIILALSFNY